MAIRKGLNNFTGGEITPFLDARIDLQKYDTSCRQLENFRPMPWGGATYRPGTVFIAAAKNANKKCRLIPFTYSTTITYMLEFGDQYVRFYRNKAVIGGPYEISSPYLEADLFQIQFKQINDVMYLVHPSYAVQKLTRLADASWTLAEVSWTYPALLDQNLGTITITPSATTGAGITLTASSALFNALHVGAYFELAYKRASTNNTLDLSAASGSSAGLSVKGDWSVVSSNYWYGTLRVQRSLDGGSTWETIREFVSQSDRNVNGSGTELVDCLLRLDFTYTGNPFGTPPWTGTPPANYVKAQAKLESSQVFVQGVAKITGYTSTTVVTATVISTLPATTATTYWSEGAWSPYRGYPKAIGLYEQRVIYAGTAYQPNTVWGSVTADFENFQYGDTDDSALAFQIADAEQNPVQWLAPLLRIHAGTSGAEHVMASGNTDEPITPSNVTVRTQTSYGSDPVPALRVDNGIIFVQRQGRRIRELREASIYANPGDAVDPDLTLLAEHITEGGLTQMDYARLPDPLVFTIRTDGVMPVMTYNREQNITAWARYTTQGLFESVACIYGAPTDEVWVVVKRTINGATVRYVEVFEPETADKTNGVYSDACLKRSGGLTNGVTVAHLPLTTTDLVADGILYKNLTSDISGNFFLPNGATASIWRVGLIYNGTIQPMKVDQVLANGTSQGKQRRISELIVRTRNTLGLKYGITTDDLMEFDYRSLTGLMDTNPDLFTGDKQVAWPGINDANADIILRQDAPFPCTVLGIFPKLEVFGD